MDKLLKSSKRMGMASDAAFDELYSMSFDELRTLAQKNVGGDMATFYIETDPAGVELIVNGTIVDRVKACLQQIKFK